MYIRIGLIAALALVCTGCVNMPAPRPIIGAPSKGDPLALDRLALPSADYPAAKTPPTAATISVEDNALFAQYHDIAVTNCLYYKNKYAAGLTIGNNTFDLGTIAFAIIPPVLAATRTKLQTITLVTGATGLLPLLAPALKTAVGGWGTAPDYSQVSQAIDNAYVIYSTSPGVAALLADSVTSGPPGTPPAGKNRDYAIYEYKFALEQACLSTLKMPGAATLYSKPASTGGAQAVVAAAAVVAPVAPAPAAPAQPPPAAPAQPQKPG